MKNAQCEGRLATLEAARRGFSDSFLSIRCHFLPLIYPTLPTRGVKSFHTSAIA